MLDWTPNTNHTGLYVAVNEGYFEQEGLHVEIIQHQEGTRTTCFSRVCPVWNQLSGKCHLCKSRGIRLYRWQQSSTIPSLQENGIVSAKDFENKKYGGWGSPIEEATLRYLMEQEGADPEKMQIVTTGDADFFQASSTGEIDYAWIFEGWAGIEARLKGMELNYIDLGKVAEVFDYYTPVIITSENQIHENRGLVEKFMRAVEKGYQFAIENPDAAAEVLMEHAPELDRDLVVESQRYLADKYQDDAPYWGMQKKEVWERYMNWLFDNTFITEKVDVSKAYTNEFLSGEE